MPAPYLKSLADKYGVSIKTLEKYWKEAKKVIADYGKYDDNDDKKWGTIVNIFKNKINKHLGFNEELGESVDINNFEYKLLILQLNEDDAG